MPVPRLSLTSASKYFFLLGMGLESERMAMSICRLTQKYASMCWPASAVAQRRSALPELFLAGGFSGAVILAAGAEDKATAKRPDPMGS